jgi:hypothetical protein
VEKEEPQWRSTMKRLVITILFLVLISVGLVLLHALFHIWNKDRSVPNTHSNEPIEFNIHGNNFMALQRKLCTLIPN